MSFEIVQNCRWVYYFFVKEGLLAALVVTKLKKKYRRLCSFLFTNEGHSADKVHSRYKLNNKTHPVSVGMGTSLLHALLVNVYAGNRRF